MLINFYALLYCVILQEHDVKTEQPATFWLERAEEVHVRFELQFHCS